MTLQQDSTALLVEKLKKGDRFALAKAITIIESHKETDQIKSKEILDKCWADRVDSWRIGITGPPGVGKSTFIDRFAEFAVQKSHKIAILSIDPSSTISYGSILGDKTRMINIANKPEVFIRPSSNRSQLGGVNEFSFETIILCESAGYDMILLETVGVGQSEVTVRQLVDFMAVLLLPNSGDELQGIKRGIMELADVFIVHKADDPEDEFVKSALEQLRHVIHLQKEKESKWNCEVIPVSSVQNSGIDNFYTNLNNYFDHSIKNNYYTLNRKQQIDNYIVKYVNKLFYKHFNSKITTHSDKQLNDLDKYSPIQIAHNLFEEVLKS